jgi:hypothetical protein
MRRFDYRPVKYTNTHEFGIHEFYFLENGEIEHWTQDSFVKPCPNLDILKEYLENVLSSMNEDETAILGDLGYEYEKVEVIELINCLKHPIIEIERVFELERLGQTPLHVQ